MLIGRKTFSALPHSGKPWWPWLMLALLLIPLLVVWLSPSLKPGVIPGRAKVTRLTRSGWFLKQTDALTTDRAGVETTYVLLREVGKRPGAGQANGQTSGKTALLMLGCRGREPVRADVLFLGPFTNLRDERLSADDLCLMDLRVDDRGPVQATCDFAPRSENSVILATIAPQILTRTAAAGQWLTVELTGPYGAMTTADFDVSEFTESYAVFRDKCGR